MRRSLSFYALFALALASTAHAADPKAAQAKCDWGRDPNCLRNYDDDYRNCYRGRSPQAIIAACKAWVAKDPLDVSAYTTLAGQYRGLGDYDAAVATYSKVIGARPKFPYAYFDRGLAYEMKGDKTRAIADYQKCLELDPKFPRAMQGLKRLGVKGL